MLPTQPTSPENDARVIALESKLAFTENTVEALNQALIEQQNQIALLLREMAAMKDFLREQAASGEGGVSRGGQELPPHY